MKQTAVEWLVEELTKQNMFMHLFAKEIEQAKAMEKEQIIRAFKSGLASPYHQDYTLVTQEGQEETKSGQYYNELYKAQKHEE